jgi:hypothetical protein
MIIGVSPPTLYGSGDNDAGIGISPAGNQVVVKVEPL